QYALDHGADFVFLINQDATIENDTINKLILIAGKYPDYGILSPIHLNAEGTEIDKNVIDYIALGTPSFISDAYFNKLDDCYSIPFINAAAWLISKECIQLVGGFDSLFFMYGEDDDYCFRTLSHGLKIGLVPSSVIFHKRIFNLPDNDKWTAIKQIAYRRASMIVVSLKRVNKRFCNNVILWEIGHLSKMLLALLKIYISEFIILLIIEFLILMKLPKIKRHWQLSRNGSPFLNKQKKV
ncbi:MAG: hypothetical protein MUO67_03310, partial [Anaerolineales bacterium]|nr:hypothetical protein [Anaerolineales bacterium]